MAKVSTDRILIEKFLNRGVDAIYPTPEELRKKLLSGEKIKAYQGFDPTGPYLHVGHAMGIRALRILQELGHEVIFLVGDYTSKVGDPDKDKARKILTDEEIAQNMSGWKEQASQLIDFEGNNPVKFMRNYEWLSKLNLSDLIGLMSKTTVQQMIERDMFQRRINEKDPIGLQEFIYPLMQGYDSVAMDVDLEIGGTDQTFNMLMGRNLMKTLKNKDKFVRTNIMMDAPDGKTMSKTKGNGINLVDKPEDMYGKAMSYNDALIIKGLRLLTDIPEEEIMDISQKIDGGANPMQFKKLMAYEIVKVIKGKDAAIKAQNHFEQTVQQGVLNDEHTVKIKLDDLLPSDTNKVGANNISSHNAGTDNENTGSQNTGSRDGIKLGDFIKLILGSDETSSNVRRVISQGGVEINSVKKTDPFEIIQIKKGDIIKFGKRLFIKII